MAITAISLIVPAHNEAVNLQYLSAKLSEIKSKITRSIELIVVDDCSTDGSNVTIFKKCPIKVKYLKNETRLGKSQSILIGYANSKSDYVDSS